MRERGQARHPVMPRSGRNAFFDGVEWEAVFEAV